MNTRKPNLKDLHDAVESVCPIDGVSRDKDGTISVQHKPTATPAQKGAATKLINRWDWNQDIQLPVSLEERVTELEARVQQLEQG